MISEVVNATIEERNGKIFHNGLELQGVNSHDVAKILAVGKSVKIFYEDGREESRGEEEKERALNKKELELLERVKAMRKNMY
jgi:hypothetical protein